jgi:hypothetical protein
MVFLAGLGVGLRRGGLVWFRVVGGDLALPVGSVRRLYGFDLFLLLGRVIRRLSHSIHKRQNLLMFYLNAPLVKQLNYFVQIGMKHLFNSRHINL